MPLYSKHRRASLVWIITAIAAVVLVYGTMFALIGSGLFKRLGDWGAVVGVAPLVIAMATGWIAMAGVTRRRIAALAGGLRAQRYEVVERPTPAQRQEFAKPIVHIFPSIGLQHGDAGVQWFAVEGGVADASALRIFEHEYVTGSGKFAQVHIRTALFWPAGHPDLPAAPLATAPWFSAARLPRLIRRSVRSHELALPGLSAFTETWSLLGNPDTARRFLAPAVIAQLDPAPRDEEWAMGAAWVCCSFRGPLDAANLDRFLEHARQVLKAVDRA